VKITAAGASADQQRIVFLLVSVSLRRKVYQGRRLTSFIRMPLFLKVFLSSGIRFVQNLQRCLADICRHRKEIKFTRLQTLRQQTKYTFLTITQA